MPEILPFRGLRYDQSRVNLQDVIAPPYDVIAPEYQERLYEKSPYNIVRLILGREENRYGSAAAFFQQWQDERILIREEKPSFYLLHQIFGEKDGRPITRRGLIALCRLEEFDRQIVLPHEKTLAKPREDRFKLFKATHANFSQVLSLYSDPGLELQQKLNGVARAELAIDVLFEQVQNKLWIIQQQDVLEDVRALFSGKQVMIADGHHRYETGLAYRDFMKAQNPGHTGEELYNFIMMFFTNIDDEGLVIYPTHRVVHSLPVLDRKKILERLEQWFILRDFSDEGVLQRALASSSVQSFGLCMKGDPLLYLLSLKPNLNPSEIIRDSIPKEVRELDVTVLHSLILAGILGISPAAQEQKRNLDYVRDAHEAFDAVRAGAAQLAFVMNAPNIQQVRAVAKAGHTMPQKSTFFYPKLVSGLVINRMSE